MIHGASGEGGGDLAPQVAWRRGADEVHGVGTELIDGLDVGQPGAEGFHGIAQGIGRGTDKGDDGWHGVR